MHVYDARNVLNNFVEILAVIHTAQKDGLMALNWLPDAPNLGCLT